MRFVLFFDFQNSKRSKWTGMAYCRRVRTQGHQAWQVSLDFCWLIYAHARPCLSLDVSPGLWIRSWFSLGYSFCTSLYYIQNLFKINKDSKILSTLMLCISSLLNQGGFIYFRGFSWKSLELFSISKLSLEKWSQCSLCSYIRECYCCLGTAVDMIFLLM